MSPPNILTQFPLWDIQRLQNLPYLLLDIRDGFYAIQLEQPEIHFVEHNNINMAEQPMSDDSSTDEETRREWERLYPQLQMTEEEVEFGTIPGSVEATTMAMAHRRAHANPTVERGKLYRKKKSAKKTKKSKPTPDVVSKVCTIL